MLNSRLIIYFLFLISFSFSQSKFNAYGLGLLRTSHHASSSALGSLGIVPSFTPNVSLDNPSTWLKLENAYVSGSYLSQIINIKNTEINSSSSGFSEILLVIPVKNKFAIGLSLKPITFQNSLFSNDTVKYNYIDKTLNIHKIYRTGGGIMSANFGLSLPLNDKMRFGFSIDNFFGSSRDEQSLFINSTPYRLFYLRSYSGSKYNFFFNGDFFENKNYLLSFYTSFGITGKTLSGEIYKFNLFEDTNNNYMPDDNDFPSIAQIDTTSFSGIYSPNDFSFAFNLNYKNKLNSFVEFQLWTDEASSPSYNNIFNDHIGSKSHVGLGLVSFGKKNAKDWQDKITYRLGSYTDNYHLSFSGKSIIENGLSFGFGFKFSSTNNQIDVSFRNGSRSFANEESELFKELNIGLSIGDVWFLRRRAKQ